MPDIGRVLEVNLEQERQCLSLVNERHRLQQQILVNEN